MNKRFLQNLCFGSVIGILCALRIPGLVAGLPFLYHPEIHRYAKHLLGMEKILFGSDFPLISPSRYFRELKDSGLTAYEIKQVLGLNAEKLLSKTPPHPTVADIDGA